MAAPAPGGAPKAAAQRDDAPEATLEAFLSAHQVAEADEIARRIAEGGEPWSQYAVLARQRSLFDPIYRALTGRGINVEVDVLGGFWTRPEILGRDRFWLRVLDNPGDNLALARLLLGPAYRLEQAATCSSWWPNPRRTRTEGARRYGDHDVLPFALADSIVDHPAIANLSEQARGRIETFHALWRELMGIATRLTLADLVGEIARVSGLATELASSADPEAELALRHLAKLCDLPATTNRSPARSISPASSTISTRSRSPSKTKTSSEQPSRTLSS